MEINAKEFETTKEGSIEGKQIDSNASSFIEAKPCIETHQSKESVHDEDSSSTREVHLSESMEAKSKISDTSMSNNGRNEPCTPEVHVTESNKPGNIIKPETVSRIAECYKKSLVVVLSSLGTVGSVKKNPSSDSSEHKSSDTDTSKTSDAKLEKHSTEKECDINNLTIVLCPDEPVLRESKIIKDCDKQQSITVEDSCNEKSKDTMGQKSPRKPETKRKPKTLRTPAAEEFGSQNTSTASNEMPSNDVNAEWSVDERRRLLLALESDGGRRRWNSIANKVKTKNVLQVKYFTECLLAEAKATVPVHLVGEKNNQLQAWICVCERLRGGQEDIDAKCIPQVMTIAAVEPTSSSPESAQGPNYARIYTFLSCVLRGQTTVGLTPVDAKVILELLQGLEIKIMNADLREQHGFLKNRYTSLVKDLEQEQIVFAMEELQKEILGGEAEEAEETSDKSFNFDGEGSTSTCKRDGGQFYGESMDTTEVEQREEWSDTSKSLPLHSSNTVGVSDMNETITFETNTSAMDIETEKTHSSPVFLPSSSITFPESDKSKVETNTLQSQASPVGSEPRTETPNTVDSKGSRRTSSRRTRKIRAMITTINESSQSRRKEDSRRLKLRKLKKDLKKPKLSSLNPVCIPVSLLNVKPKSYRP